MKALNSDFCLISLDVFLLFHPSLFALDIRKKCKNDKRDRVESYGKAVVRQFRYRTKRHRLELWPTIFVHRSRFGSQCYNVCSFCHPSSHVGYSLGDLKMSYPGRAHKSLRFERRMVNGRRFGFMVWYQKWPTITMNHDRASSNAKIEEVSQESHPFKTLPRYLVQGRWFEWQQPCKYCSIRYDLAADIIAHAGKLHRLFALY